MRLDGDQDESHTAKAMEDGYYVCLMEFGSGGMHGSCKMSVLEMQQPVYNHLFLRSKLPAQVLLVVPL